MSELSDKKLYKKDDLIDKKLYKKDDLIDKKSTDDAYQKMLDEAEREANKLRMLHEEERKKALIHYIGSSAKIDPQDLMKYIDLLEQSEGAEESQISKGRTK